jgi:hypothetical protein
MRPPSNVAQQGAPSRECIADGRGHLGLAGQGRELLFHPGAQIVDQWPRSCASDLLALVGRSATDLALDGIQSADAFDGFSSNRRSERYMEIVELAPYMGPARSFLDAAISIEMMEAGVAIRLQRAAEVAQMLARMFSLAIR